jgi:hypothetical protein
MTRELFRQGGPYGIRKTGADQYTMTVRLPTDEHGRAARGCPDSECSPGYFKVKLGTGITGGQEEAFCPYCRKSGEPSDFTTKEQIRYATDIATREVADGVGAMVRNALGLGPSGRRKMGSGMFSVEMSLKEGPRPHVWRPFEEDLLRCVVCPHCGLDHAVFGIAIWCPDCGADIFMEHVRAECNVVREILGDVDRRREALGPRVAARDLENCLEDTVSIFEAVLKALLVRHLRSAGETEEAIHTLLSGRIRNGFQSPRRAEEIVRKRMGLELFDETPSEQVDRLCATIEKRHPITHNLGVVDRKYLERAYEAEREGREVSVSKGEIEQAIDVCLATLARLHARAFCGPTESVDNAMGPSPQRLTEA